MEKYIKNYKEWIAETWMKLDKKLSYVAVKSRDKIPYTTIDGEHSNMLERDPACWTNGFWGALMWLMYIDTEKEEYKITAERAEELLDGAFERFYSLHHDVGFMWDITSGVNYRLTQNPKSKRRIGYASAILASRYNIDGKFIRAWPNWPEQDNTGVTIIDCMMNIPLLYRASEMIGDNRFKSIAMSHADTTLMHHIRNDGSVYHIVEHNPHNGEIIDYRAGQGYEKESSWSRGQAWALYGFVLSYIHTKEQRYLDTAKKVAHYFISNISINEYLPLVDFRAPDEPVLYDSTAGACAACGLIEISKFVPEYEKRLYIDSAIKLLVAMEKKFCNWDNEEDSILQMGTEAYNRGIHMPIIYGDFFFTEALFKLRGNDFLVW